MRPLADLPVDVYTHLAYVLPFILPCELRAAPTFENKSLSSAVADR